MKYWKGVFKYVLSPFVSLKVYVATLRYTIVATCAATNHQPGIIVSAGAVIIYLTPHLGYGVYVA